MEQPLSIPKAVSILCQRRAEAHSQGGHKQIERNVTDVLDGVNALNGPKCIAKRS